MYLKRIEIIGFKSFADKTVLDFGRGITGIVGPNGCGKSNISDAVRWCLGEQSAKAIRLPSANMQAVIFGGASKRQSAGMAEVSLIFDNSQNVLPIEFSEVQVTRKLFKNGESEYFINKSQCKLKDIRDLFLDTGIGLDGYSIIEQGKVDFLTNAKPEQRRELFEEAAGVAKYKVRREEALRRLEKAEADMGRLAVAMTFQKEQIGLLDQQAKKARQFKKYQEDLKKYEAADLVSQITYGDKEIERINQELEPKTIEFETSNTNALSLDGDIEQMRIALDEKNDQFIQLNAELSEITSQIAISDQIIKSALEQEEGLNIEQERLTLELEENKNKVSQYESELSANTDDAALALEVEGLQNSFKQTEEKYNEIKIKLSALSASSAQLQVEIEEIESQKEIQTNTKAQVLESQMRLTVESESLARQIAKLESDIEPSNNEIAILEQELAQAKQTLLTSQAKQDELQAEILENENKLNDAQEKMSALQETLTSNQSRIETLQEFDKKDPIRSAIRAVISLGVAQGPVSSLIDAQVENEDLIVAAFGDKLNYLICKNTQDAEKAIEYLQENNLPRLSFIIEDKIPQINNPSLMLPQSSTELIKLISYKAENEKLVRFLCAEQMVANKKIYGKVIVCGGGKTMTEKPALIEEQIKRLQDSNDKMKQDIALFETDINTFTETHTQKKVEKERISFDCVRLNTQIENKDEQIKEKKFDITGYNDEIAKNKQSYAAQQTDLEKINEQIAICDEQISQLSDKETALNLEISKVDDELAAIRLEEETTSPLLMEARSLFDRKNGEFENKQKGRQYIQENIDNVRGSIDSSTNRIADNARKIENFINTQTQEAQKIALLHEDRATKEAAIQVSLSDKEELNRQIDQKNEESRKFKNINDALKHDLDTLQIDLKNSQYQRNNLAQNLIAEFGKTYEEMKNDFADVEVNKEEIARIKRKIEALGAINHGAPEEYDALEQRYNFLLGQQQELFTARDNIHEAIKKINDSTIENFKNTFELVRTNFRQLYESLFGGGEADLKLTDESNLLESGIDIIAQPPGKKTQHISLLSGGEKAMTAVALLFALFMSKASPFCILDEVDAPLDDANRGRYNEIVKNFAKNTQFLVVTHNSKTMEAADVLYGVTMEEKGVSKIISAKFNKAQE